MRRHFTGVDYPLVILALLLSAFGIATVYSAGQTDIVTRVNLTGLWRTQATYLALGLGAAWVVSRASVRILDYAAPVLYVGTVIVLVLLLVGLGGGGGTAKSSNSWLVLGGVRLGQPSELAKLTVVIMLAKVLAGRGEAPKTLAQLWQPAAIVGIPWLLVMKQPDLGTGLVFIGIFFAMLFWAGTSWQVLLLASSPVISLALASSRNLWGAWFLLFLFFVYKARPNAIESVAVILANVAFGVVAPVIWENLKPHQQQRLLVFLDPSSDPLASGYHVLQSQVAIGSGGFFGKGFTQGSQKRFGFLPEQHTDFIFPVIGEELGFFGVAIALALFAWLMMRCIRIAGRSTNPFASLVAFGLVAMLFTHVLINVGMTIGIMPVTGIPLPFFSYGGSFMLSCWIAIGVLIRLSVEGRGRADTLVI